MSHNVEYFPNEYFGLWTFMNELHFSYIRNNSVKNAREPKSNSRRITCKGMFRGREHRIWWMFVNRYYRNILRLWSAMAKGLEKITLKVYDAVYKPINYSFGKRPRRIVWQRAGFLIFFFEFESCQTLLFFAMKMFLSYFWTAMEQIWMVHTMKNGDDILYGKLT